MVFHTIITIGLAASTAYLYWKLRQSNISLFEKDSIIDALQAHSRKVETVLDAKHAELNALRSQLTAKAKPVVKKATETVKEAVSKPKRRYSRKPKTPKA